MGFIGGGRQRQHVLLQFVYIGMEYESAAVGPFVAREFVEIDEFPSLRDPHFLPEAVEAALGRGADQRTLLAADFCILVTTLSAEEWPLEELLALYRVRWQVEWCIRRWKSLCELKQLPAYPAFIAEVVLKARLVLILLLHQRFAGLDLPWRQWWAGEILPPVISTLIVSIYRCLCDIVRPAAALKRLLENPKRYLRHLYSSRRKRPLQWAEAAGRWFRRLAQETAPNGA